MAINLQEKNTLVSNRAPLKGHPRVRGRLLRLVAVLGAVVVLSLAPVSVDVSLAAVSPPTAVVIVEGQRFNAVPGLVLAQGQVDAANQMCYGVNHRIEISVPKTIGYALVDVGVTDTCALVIREIVFKNEHVLPDGTRLSGRAAAGSTLRERFAPSTVALADTQHQIYGRHVMHEQFHITTTLAHQQYNYWEGPASVYSPSAVTEYCWHDGAGWTNLSCYAGTELTGPSQVQRYTAGSWTNQGGSLQHNLGAHPNAWIGGNSVWCDGVGAGMPFGWHDHCEYGRLW